MSGRLVAVVAGLAGLVAGGGDWRRRGWPAWANHDHYCHDHNHGHRSDQDREAGADRHDDRYENPDEDGDDHGCEYLAASAPSGGHPASPGGSCNGADPCPPRGPSGANGTYTCADFDTNRRQAYFDQGDIDGLDANHDGVPCGSLP